MFCFNLATTVVVLSCLESIIFRINGDCGCSSDEVTTSYESITISNLRDVDYTGTGIYVYSFSGEWSVVEGDCRNGYRYYYSEVYNTIEESDETFILYYNGANRWEIAKPSYSQPWAYCNSKDIEDCVSGNFYVYCGYNTYCGDDGNSISTQECDDRRRLGEEDKLGMTKRSLISSSGCSSDDKFNYDSVRISNLEPVYYTTTVIVYDFNGDWTVEIDDCKNGYSYYTLQVYNTIEEVYVPFILYYSGTSSWIIAKPSYTTPWGYCNEEYLSDCRNKFYVYYAGSYKIDLSTSVITTTSDSGDDDDDDDDDTNDDDDICGCSDDSSNNYDSVTLSGLSQVNYDGQGTYVYDFNGIWEVSVDDCKNGYTYFSKSVLNIISGTDETFSLYNDGGYVWIIAKPSYSQPWAYCYESQIYDCDNNWNIYNGGSYLLDSSCDVSVSSCVISENGRIDTGNRSDDESSDNNSSDEMEGWAWLLIGVTIGLVVGLIGCFGYLKCYGGANKQVGYDSSKKEHLLATDNGGNTDQDYQKMEG